MREEKMKDRIHIFPTMELLLRKREQSEKQLEQLSVFPQLIRVDELMKKEYDQGNYMVQGEALEKEAGRLAKILVHEQPQTRKILTFLIREIMRNTPEHGKSRELWFCGQSNSLEGWVEIACVDEGIGIFKSLTENPAHRKYIADGREALQWAVKAGISAAFRPSAKQTSNDEWANSGFGLYMVSQICRKTGGSFQLLSGSSCLTIEKDSVLEDVDFWAGTGVSIRIPEAKVTDAQKLIYDTSLEGEKMAREIRTAFKRASKPSQGLRL